MAIKKSAKKSGAKVSNVSQQAKQKGLVSMGFGRWGKNNKVTHIARNGKLVVANKGELGGSGAHNKAIGSLRKLLVNTRQHLSKLATMLQKARKAKKDVQPIQDKIKLMMDRQSKYRHQLQKLLA